MHEGYEAKAFPSLALLAGVVNRLGNGRGKGVEIKPPAWLVQARKQLANSKDDLDLARASWTQFSARQAARRGDETPPPKAG